MRESASTDLREPQGSNPLGPPGPELCIARNLLNNYCCTEPPIEDVPIIRQRELLVSPELIWALGSEGARPGVQFTGRLPTWLDPDSA